MTSLLPLLARAQLPLAITLAVVAGVLAYLGQHMLATAILPLAGALGLPRPSEIATATHGALDALRPRAPETHEAPPQIGFASPPPTDPPAGS